MSVPPPTPTAADEAEFTAGLRRLKVWSGLSLRQLERRAAAVGETLPYSTVATMLGRDRLPRVELLTTFVRACGLDDDGVAAWVAVRTAIATGADAAPATPVTSATPVARPTRSARRWWRLPVAAAAVGLAFVAGAVLTPDGVGTVEQETVIVAP